MLTSEGVSLSVLKADDRREEAGLLLISAEITKRRW
jgi:hypothetical protein